MTDVREFEVNKGITDGKYKTCLVCEKKFELGEKIVLAPIQQPRTGWATVMSIPIHADCYWVDRTK